MTLNPASTSASLSISRIVRESSTVTVHRPDLTLQGLRLVYDKNV